MRNIGLYCLLLAILPVLGCRNYTDNRGSIPSFGSDSRTQEVAESKAVDAVNNVTHYDKLSMAQAIYLGLKSDPKLKALGWYLDAAESSQLQAGLAPVLELELELEEFAGTGDRQGFDAAEVGLLLTKTFETGNKSERRVELARIERTLAQLDCLLAAQDKSLAIATACIELASGQMMVELAQDNLAVAQENNAAITKLASNGQASGSELIRAGLELNQAERYYLQEQEQLKIYRGNLAALWTGQEVEYQELAIDLKEVSPAIGLAELESAALASGRYKYITDKARHGIAAAELARTSAKSDFAMGVGVRYFNETEDQAMVVNIAVPLASPKGRNAILRESVANMAATEELEKAAKLEFQAGLYLAHNELMAKRQQVMILQEQIVPAAQELFANARQLHQLGKSDCLTLLEAKKSLFEVRSQYIAALTDYHKARLTVMQFTGEILEQQNISQEVKNAE